MQQHYLDPTDAASAGRLIRSGPMPAHVRAFGRYRMLYADAYSLVTQRVLGNAAGATPTPAFLSATTALKDVVPHWRTIQGDAQ